VLFFGCSKNNKTVSEIVEEYAPVLSNDGDVVIANVTEKRSITDYYDEIMHGYGVLRFHRDKYGVIDIFMGKIGKHKRKY